MTYDTDDSHPDHLQILTVERKGRRLHVTEYVDMTIGEILSATQVRKMGVKEIRPDARVRRERILNGLRKEVRQFADFVLTFRNGRGGFAPGIDELVRWYAFLHDRRPNDVRRLVQRLVEGGVIEQVPHGEHVPTHDLMWLRSAPTKASVKGEYSSALVKFDRLLIARRAATEKEERQAA